MIGHAAAFLGISALVIVTPGQDTALTIRNALLGGRRAALFTALGVSAGQALWALATAAGVAALLAASEPVFVALRLAGAAYLIWLGVQALLAALRRRHLEQVHECTNLRARVAFRQGFVSNLGNPKMAVFFLSLLPQFGGSFAALLALGLVFSCLTLVWLTAYGAAVARAGDFLRRSRVRRALDAAVGTVLVALGLRIAREAR
ncbi:MAG: LysE family translocator [Thermoleophilia bacterium]